MSIKKISLIYAAVLLLQLLCGWTDSGWTCSASAESEAKLDPSLANLLDGSGDDPIPVIVIFKEQEKRIFGDLRVRYNYHFMNAAAGEASPQAVSRLAASHAVEKIYLDNIIKVAQPEESGSRNESICPAKMINADILWAQGIDGRGVRVAVLDSGIDKNHPDLAGKVVAEKNFVLDEATTDDLLGHGTMVAGIVAGTGEASGGKYKGVAPGASLLNAKVIDKSGGGRVSDIIAGMEWALDNDADILSLSLGGMNLGETNPPVTMAADNAAEAGAVICVAAGNRNNSRDQNSPLSSMLPSALLGADSKVDLGRAGLSQLDGSYSRDVLLLFVVLALPPGLIDSPGDGVNVITLGASDCNDYVASFSGSGPTRDGRTKPSLVAPGVNVVSCVPPGLEDLDYMDVYYTRSSGTSLSTPVAAGAAALMLQADPSLTPAGIKAAMALGAKKLNNSQEEEYEEYYQGVGRLDANQSLQLLNPDLCGVVPDKWNAGRWAYLGAGKGLYVGLDTGADRPQKKIYALAPKDDDSNQLVFFTNKERANLSTEAKGVVSSWITVQPLPKTIPANEHRILGASITVPVGTPPGEYSGSIDISEGNRTISSIPVTAVVAEPLIFHKGRALADGQLKDDKWSYYFLDISLGTSELKSRLSWEEEAELDLFILAPTSEYYAGSQKDKMEDLNIENPPSGHWLLAIHARNLPEPVNYSLILEQSRLEASPKRWNAGDVQPGSISNELFTLENAGLPLSNLSYGGTIENVSILEFKGSIGHKDLHEEYFLVPEGTSKLSVNMTAEDGDGDIAFLLLDPSDIRVYASLGPESLGSPEVSYPDPGKWRIWVYGSGVPAGKNESFTIEVMRYIQEPWTWLSARGPSSIESDSNATIDAMLEVPANASSRSMAGYIGIQSDTQSFQIPVSLNVAGTELAGLKDSKVEDGNNDGYFDRLSVAIAVNATVPGYYTVQGSLEDCQGNKIKWLKGASSFQGESTISMDVAGQEIWRKGKCGPLMIQNLLLYNEQGDLVDRYNESIIINESPGEFQPPFAYLTGEFADKSTRSSIEIGVDLMVIKAGSYELAARIDDDNGEELGRESVIARLEPGKRNLTLKFNPTKFKMMGEPSRFHLRDLTLKLEGIVLESIDDAWSSDTVDPEYFNRSAGLVRTGRGMPIIP